MTCKILEETVPAYVYDEIAPEERAAYESHLAGCENCRQLVEETRRLHHLLNQRAGVEPTPELIVRCRQSLDEALDREQLGWRSLIRSFFPLGLNMPGRLAGSGAVGAVVLALFGFGLGWTLRGHGRQTLHPGTGEVLSPITASDLTNLKVKDISELTPDPKTGDVRITVNAERRVTMEGSLDDPHIRELLVSAVKGY